MKNNNGITAVVARVLLSISGTTFFEDNLFPKYGASGWGALLII